MDVTYLGHASFKLKGKGATVVTDPYSNKVGFSFPRVSADIVTVSHQHDDHNNFKVVLGTARREKPFIIDTAGEYEVNGVGVFGVRMYHDKKKGEERGENLVFSILIDGISVVHLGDLGHLLSESQVSDLDGVDVLLCPVGGKYTIGPEEVGEIINAVEPSVVVPMHYKTAKHDKKIFGELVDVDTFLDRLSVKAKRMEKLSLSKATLPEEMEVVVLESQAT